MRRDALIGQTALRHPARARSPSASPRTTAQLIEKGGVRTLEQRAPRPGDGIERDAIFSKSTFRNADGEVAGIVGVVVDITGEEEPRGRHAREPHAAARDRGGRAARHHRARLRQRDPGLEPGAERLFGWSAEEIVGTHDRDRARAPARRSAPACASARRRARPSYIEETQRQHKRRHARRCLRGHRAAARRRGPRLQHDGHHRRHPPAQGGRARAGRERGPAAPGDGGRAHGRCGTGRPATTTTPTPTASIRSSAARSTRRTWATSALQAQLHARRPRALPGDDAATRCARARISRSTIA